MKLIKQIEEEIGGFISGTVPIHDGDQFSQYKLVRRIHMYANQIYPGNKKVTKQGDYKYWYDIIQPRIDGEVKNIDFDTKNIELYDETKADQVPLVIANLALEAWMRETGQAEELNAAIEQGSGWGNILWKKVKDGFQRSDLKNTYIINQTAETVDDTPVIERHQLVQSDLRAKAGVWKNVETVIDKCKNMTFSPSAQTSETDTTLPYYEIYERNGEVSEADLFEAQGKTGGDENKFILAKVIVAGIQKGKRDAAQILFAEKLSGKMSDIYKEYHRGRYNGRWWRTGLIELLMDCQTRANEIGNQLARGLEWASKTIFRSETLLIAQNILTDLKSGDVLKSKDLQQVEVRMQGFDQLIADWNRNIQLANDISNAREIVQGDQLPSGTPFRLGALMNVNANKLYDFIREKLAIVFTDIFEEWVVPEFLKDLKAKDVVRLTGDSEMLDRLIDAIVDSWYRGNLIAIGPHTPEVAEFLKDKQRDDLKKRPQLLVKLMKDLMKDFQVRARIVITGEQVNLDADLTTLESFIKLEADPVRRSAMIEMAMRKKGLDVGALPKTPPMAAAPAMGPARSAGPMQPSQIAA